jgi:hypothetical protein
MSELEVETASDGQLVATRHATLRQHLFVVLTCDRPLDGGARYGLADSNERSYAGSSSG